jgi:hypothetical protein
LALRPWTPRAPASQRFHKRSAHSRESAESWLDELGRFSIKAEHIDRLNGYAAIAEDIERRAAAVSAPVASRAAKIKTNLWFLIEMTARNR